MDAAIVAQINSKCGANDTLWVLGDFAFRGRSPLHYLKQLICKDVRLVLGNHDKRTPCYFASMCDVTQISIGAQLIWLSHYAHRSWPASHRGSWHLYGHSHGKMDADDVARGLAALDVGIDNCARYGLAFAEPWTLDDISKVLPRNNKQALNDV